AVTFFRVSKLTHRGPERQCNPARDRNPAKGKPLLRQGTDGNRSRAGDISFHFTLQPPVFLRLLTWGMSCPLRIRLTLRLRRCGFPHSKSQENYGDFR
ncbi:MAG: hypothetical protein DRP28_07215, partial [Thermodesulfobacteriota bacterium]